MPVIYDSAKIPDVPIRPSLVERIYAFYLEHRLCDRLEGDVEMNDTGRRVVALRCSCAAELVRPADEP
jgi:hypothetical protein